MKMNINIKKKILRTNNEINSYIFINFLEQNKNIINEKQLL